MDVTAWIQVSAVIFIVGVVLSVLLEVVSRIKKENWKIPSFTCLTIFTFIAFLIVFYQGNIKAEGGNVGRTLVTILDTLSVFRGEKGIGDTKEIAELALEEYQSRVFIYIAILHLAASGIVVSIILKLLDQFFPRVTYMLLSWGHLYIFSGISEREVLLAEDIRETEKGKHLKRSVLVFLKSKEEGNNIEGLTERIHRISGYVFSDEVGQLPIPWLCKMSHIDYFLLKEVDGENITDALTLAEEYVEEGSNICIHVLSDNPETEYLLDAVAGKAKCDFRLISETRSMLYQLLDRKPLFLGEKDEQLCILIVGAGRNGQEAVKACSWCGYTGKLEPRIWVVDKLEESYLKLKKDCPEMMEKDVNFVQLDVESPAFLDFLREHQEIGYVICALGDEHLNLRIALEIRAVSYENGPYDEKSKKLPIINVLLNDKALYETCEKLCFTIDRKENKTRSYDLNPFGSFKEFYTWNNMGNSYLEGGALAVHRFYEGEGQSRKDFYDTYKKSNYNRDSSMAAALHGKYKAYTVLCEIMGKDQFDWTKQVDEHLDDKKNVGTNVGMRKLLVEYLYNADVDVAERMHRMEMLAELEHKRWNAYMRARGWRTATKKQVSEWKPELKKSQNTPAKLHPNIVEWVEFDETDNNDRNAMQYDRSLIWNLPFILEEAAGFDESFYEKRRCYNVKWRDRGIYRKKDFEAIAYWYKYPIKAGQTIALCGSDKMVRTYLKQALLMHIFLENPPQYEIYCDTPIDLEYLEVDDHVKTIINETVVYKGPQSKLRRDEENAVFEDETKKKLSRSYIFELEEELIQAAKALNDSYNVNNPENATEWKKLSAFLKGSNICAAAFVRMHRSNFASKMELKHLAEIEHNRWCRYHYVHGWKQGVKDKKAKTHNCLVAFDELDSMKTEGNDYKENDKNSVRQGLQLMQKG